jgi:hypothetical protein
MRTKAKLLMVALICMSQIISCKKDTSCTCTCPPVDNEKTDSTLIAWYTFDNDVLDHSGNNNNVIFNNASLTSGKKGLEKTAYNFDGAGNYMQVANSASLNVPEITIYALVKPNGFYQSKCHGNRIISKGFNDYDNGRIDLGFDDAAYYNYEGCDAPVQNNFQNFYGSYGDGVNATGATNFSDYIQTNQWYGIVYTYDGVYSNLYVNGILVNQVKQSTTFNSNSYPLYIGRNQDPQYPYYFNGVIDEIKIFKKALSASEAAELSK